MEELFRSIRIGTLELPNRFVMAPMESGLPMIGGGINDDTRAFYRLRAAGGAGLLLTGGIAVSAEGRASPRQMCLFNEAALFGMQELVDVVHGAGARFGAQLTHGGRQATQKVSRFPPVAPSAVPCAPLDNDPQAMRPEDFARVLDDYVAAARQAEALGFDLIELQMSGGFLLHSFFTLHTNRRADEYGGDFENRLRYPMQVLQAVVQAVSLPVTVRIPGPGGDAGDETGSALSPRENSSQKEPPSGITAGEMVCIAETAAGLGAAGISLGAGSYDEPEAMAPPMYTPPAPLLEAARRVKKAVDLPVMAGGRLPTPQELEKAGQTADLVMLGRPLIADPALVNKLREGREEEIVPCVFCNQGCVDNVSQGAGVMCMVNPLAGYERRRRMPSATTAAKQVVVIGGGPGGLMAARTAALRGHRVTLLEGEKKLGGLLNLLAALPEKEELRRFTAYLTRDLAALGIQVEHRTLDNASELAAYAPDAVVVAAGARQAIAPFPVKADADLVMAEDILARRVEAGGVVTVIGGERAGLYTAKALCSAGKTVHIVDDRPGLDGFPGVTYRRHELAYLAKRGVQWHFGREVMAVEKGRVLLDKGHIECDTVVVALGYYPNISCAQPVKNRYNEVYVVGDAKEPRSILDTVAEGYEAGCKL